MKNSNAMIRTGCAIAALAVAACGRPAERPPNVVIIFTDDQGYADVGAYGAVGFETPNIDRLAAEGMRFTRFYTAESGCSPSRAALLTGRYPLRAGMPTVLAPRSVVGLNADETTLAEILKRQGYATAAVGKWHLGDHPDFLPLRHGFDSYFGLPYSNDMSPDPRNNPWERARSHPPLPLVRDTTIIEREPDQSTLTRRYTEEAIAFIEANRDRPFFLYLAHTMAHVPLYVSDAFRGSSEQGMYGDVIQEIDWSVGAIMATLERLGLDESTLVFFASDNGPWLVFGDHAGSAGPFREGKATAFEGGHLVPGIYRWTGTIPAGAVSDEVVTAMDVFPTVAGIVGIELRDDLIIDGHDIWPLVSGQPGATSPYEALFYYRRGNLHAVRSGKWKLHVPHDYPTLEGGTVGSGGQPGNYATGHIELSLFDLDNDPSESTNVAAEYPEVIERLLELIERARAEIGDRATGRQGSQAREPGRVAEPWSQQQQRAKQQ
jgi:arylsulfatase A-like enzyme